MIKKRYRFVTALVLTLALVFVMIPSSVNAEEVSDVKYINLTVKNLNFDKSYLDEDGVVQKPEFRGGMRILDIPLDRDDRVVDAIVKKLGRDSDGERNVQIDYPGSATGTIKSFFGLKNGATVVKDSNDQGRGRWVTYYNGKEVAALNAYINGAGGSDVEVENEAEIVIAYTLDGDVTEFPYIETPKSVKAVNSTYNSNKISWTSYGNPGGFNQTEYILESSTSKTSGFKPIRTIKTSARNMSYTHTNLKTGKTYYYRVKMKKTLNESTYSTVASAKPVLKATSVKVAKKGKKALKVSWKKVSGVKYYDVYKATKKKGKYKKLKTLSASKASYTDKKVKKGKKYYYKVRAYTIVDGKKIYSPYSGIKYKKR